MRYRSTRGSDYFGFREILFAGLANDGGLFIPENWPNINHKDINRNVSYEDLTEIILSPFIGDEIESDQLKRIIKEAYSNNFTESGCVSFKELNTNEIIVELFNGPTLAFKDFAMQLLIPLFDHFLEKEKKRINLIVATSGDTGSAAINAVKKSKNINIFCLYPKGRISEFQRRQMSTVNQENIFLCEVEGTFDDCQKIVKDILKDTDYSMHNNISAVNSINWARIIIQSVYYFYTFINFTERASNKVNFSVPTGNFGDIYAGYVSYKMGLPINKLIVATNENDILNRFMKSGVYESKTVIKTSSPSMDIQVASNFERLLFDILNQSNTETKVSMENFEESGKISISEENLEKVREVFSSNSSSMDIVQNTIKSVKDNFSYVIDPHTATGLDASRFEKDMDRLNFVLATAHHVKFSEVVEKSIGEGLNLMSKYNYLFDAEEKMYKMENNTIRIKEFIREQIS